MSKLLFYVSLAFAVAQYQAGKGVADIMQADFPLQVVRNCPISSCVDGSTLICLSRCSFNRFKMPETGLAAINRVSRESTIKSDKTLSCDWSLVL